MWKKEAIQKRRNKIENNVEKRNEKDQMKETSKTSHNLFGSAATCMEEEDVLDRRRTLPTKRILL